MRPALRRKAGQRPQPSCPLARQGCGGMWPASWSLAGLELLRKRPHLARPGGIRNGLVPPCRLGAPALHACLEMGPQGLQLPAYLDAHGGLQALQPQHQLHVCLRTAGLHAQAHRQVRAVLPHVGHELLYTWESVQLCGREGAQPGAGGEDMGEGAGSWPVQAQAPHLLTQQTGGEREAPTGRTARRFSLADSRCISAALKHANASPCKRPAQPSLTTLRRPPPLTAAMRRQGSRQRL